MSTIFSKIIAGEIPGRFVWKDDVCAVFATIEPITPGHMLVVPREEIAKFTDADDATLSHLSVVAKHIGQAVERAFDAPRSALIIAGFEIDHLHLHVLPAWGDDQLSFANASPASPQELDAAAEAVRVALRDLGFGAFVPDAS
ncbi:MAG: HIT family protein [Propionibacteriaceae bacterium]|jgi:diadenosine tetraphosphate (Ap4A) HIT family hydrolase|nr:HIT family protein [Propionibacteriaceae bacterium]